MSNDNRKQIYEAPLTTVLFTEDVMQTFRNASIYDGSTNQLIDTFPVNDDALNPTSNGTGTNTQSNDDYYNQDNWDKWGAD